MTSSQRGIDSYRHVEAASRTPLELVVMLYDGALRFARDARDATARRDVRARQLATSRLLAILSELQSTLDLSQGAIAHQLDALYAFVSRRVVDGTLNFEMQAIDEAIGVLQTLREGWATIAAQTSIEGHR